MKLPNNRFDLTARSSAAFGQATWRGQVNRGVMSRKIKKKAMNPNITIRDIIKGVLFTAAFVVIAYLAKIALNIGMMETTNYVFAKLQNKYLLIGLIIVGIPLFAVLSSLYTSSEFGLHSRKLAGKNYEESLSDEPLVNFSGAKITKRQANQAGFAVVLGVVGTSVAAFLFGITNKAILLAISLFFVCIGYFWLANLAFRSTQPIDIKEKNS